MVTLFEDVTFCHCMKTIMNLFICFARTIDNIPWQTTAFLYILNLEILNLFYQNFNTNENFYRILLVRQNKTKAIIPKHIAYHYSFEKYVKNYLPSSVDDVKKFDLYANRNSTYLLYKFNHWIQSLQGAEKLIIQHAAKAKDS